MAADRAAPDLDVETRIPLLDEFVCGALDGRRWNEPIELLERMLDRDDGRAE